MLSGTISRQYGEGSVCSLPSNRQKARGVWRPTTNHWQIGSGSKRKRKGFSAYYREQPVAGYNWTTVNMCSLNVFRRRRSLSSSFFLVSIFILFSPLPPFLFYCRVPFCLFLAIFLQRKPRFFETAGTTIPLPLPTTTVSRYDIAIVVRPVLFPLYYYYFSIFF